MLAMIYAALFSGLLAQTTPVIGQVAPDFELDDIDGQSRALATMLQHGPVVLAFFPKAFTPG